MVLDGRLLVWVSEFFSFSDAPTGSKATTIFEAVYWGRRMGMGENLGNDEGTAKRACVWCARAAECVICKSACTERACWLWPKSGCFPRTWCRVADAHRGTLFTGPGRMANCTGYRNMHTAGGGVEARNSVVWSIWSMRMLLWDVQTDGGGGFKAASTVLVEQSFGSVVT